LRRLVVPIEREAGAELYSGTLAVRGLGWLVVTSTGSTPALGGHRRGVES
jgi:hypothetical protein